MKCEICKKEFNGQRGLSSHLRQSHDITTIQDFKEYYDQYILDDDITCPICKIHPKKFYSFKVGYTKTCIGQKDENGKLLNCRTHWANKDKEKARKNSIEVMRKLKETPSEEDSTKSKFDVKLEKWYKNMSKKDDMGMTKFDDIGIKVSIDHLTIDPKTGKTKATAYATKAAEYNRNTIMPDGRTKHQHISQQAADTVSSIIFPDGRTQKEHMTDKANETRSEVLPNGLTKAQDTARRAYETKVKNGTLPKYYGYSKISESTFKRLIDELNLDKSRCFYADHEKQFINEKEKECYRFDFTYIDEFGYPIIIIEFQGNQYHLRESELKFRKEETNPHGELLIEGFERDQIKKSFITQNYPNCSFFEIWEDTIDNDINFIIQQVS